MATYLFLWNPKKWAWKDLQKQIEELSAGKKLMNLGQQEIEQKV